MEQTQIDGANGRTHCKFSGIALHIDSETHEASIQLFHGACLVVLVLLKSKKKNTASLLLVIKLRMNRRVEYQHREIFIEPRLSIK